MQCDKTGSVRMECRIIAPCGVSPSTKSSRPTHVRPCPINCPSPCPWPCPCVVPVTAVLQDGLHSIINSREGLRLASTCTYWYVRVACLCFRSPGTRYMLEGYARGRVLNLFRSVGTVGMERDYSWPFHSKLFVSILNFQATEQPTRTEHNPTDFCGGTAQLDPKTGVPSRGQRVILAQIMTFHANIPQGKPQSGRCEPPSRTFGESVEVMIPPSRLDDDS